MGTVAQEFIDEGIAQGVEHGIAQGIVQGIDDGIRRGIDEGMDGEGIAQGIEQSIMRGVKQGIRRGIDRAKAAMLFRLMTQKFGSLSDPDRDRIGSATPAELEAWMEAIFEAGSPDAVFAAGRRK